MVGLNVVSANEIGNFEYKIDRVLERMIHYPSYESKTFYRDEGVFIGATCYEEYPMFYSEDDGVLFIMEGRIYNSDALTVRSIVKDIVNSYRNNNNFLEIVKEAIRDWDGEFVILVYIKKDNTIIIFNDRLGRLPFFYKMDKEGFAASRELKFVYPFIPDTSFNKAALAEYLAYGFSLGLGTIINGAFRLPPATLLIYDRQNNNLTKEQIISIDFERMMKPLRSKEEAVKGLKAAFLEGLDHRVNRVEMKNNVIALSGGLDSRATLAGLIQLGVVPKAKTYDTDPCNIAEREVTQKVADLFGTPLEYLTISREKEGQISIDDHHRFVHLFDGAPPTSFTNLMKIQEQMVLGEGHGITYFTGLYGGEMFRYLGIISGLNSDKDLIRYLMTTPDKFRYSLQKVCRILNIKLDEFEGHLSNNIAEYPENEPKLKYLHFQFEKNFKWAGMGEDRNRYYFWTTTPFFSMPFFDYAYSIDEKYKNTLFFRQFLYELDSKTCNVAYYNSNMPLDDLGRLWRLSILENAARRPYIRKIYWKIINLKNDISSTNNDCDDLENVKSQIFQLLSSSKMIKNTFNHKECEDVVKSESNLYMLHRILTLFIFINEVDNFHVSLEN